jgi:hypothetical protein
VHMVHGPFLSSLLKAIPTKVKYPYFEPRRYPSGKSMAGPVSFLLLFPLWSFLLCRLSATSFGSVVTYAYAIFILPFRIEGNNRSDGPCVSLCVWHYQIYMRLGSRENASKQKSTGILNKYFIRFKI